MYIGRCWKHVKKLTTSLRDRHTKMDSRLPPGSKVVTIPKLYQKRSYSLFLDHLPLEIRLEIYAYVFGDEGVHLLHEKRRVAHVRCRQTNPRWDCSERRAAAGKLREWGMARDNEDAFGWGPKIETAGYLSWTDVAILQTCQQVYAEAAAILYSKLVFQVDTLDTWNYFSERLRPQTLGTIKHVRASWKNQGASDVSLIGLDVAPAPQQTHGDRITPETFEPMTATPRPRCNSI